MKTMMFAAAALTLAASVNPVSALAADPGAYSAKVMSQTAEKPSSNRSADPRYVWQYHYGHHANYEGQWVLAR